MWVRVAFESQLLKRRNPPSRHDYADLSETDGGKPKESPDEARERAKFVTLVLLPMPEVAPNSYCVYLRPEPGLRVEFRRRERSLATKNAFEGFP